MQATGSRLTVLYHRSAAAEFRGPCIETAEFRSADEMHGCALRQGRPHFMADQKTRQVVWRRRFAQRPRKPERAHPEEMVEQAPGLAGAREAFVEGGHITRPV